MLWEAPGLTKIVAENGQVWKTVRLVLKSLGKVKVRRSLLRLVKSGTTCSKEEKLAVKLICMLHEEEGC